MATATPQAIVVYDFALNACSAIWISGAGLQPCPGTIENPQGFVYQIDGPQTEDGTYGQRGMLTAVDNSSNGIMLGIFPALAIKSGDHFRARLSCKYQISPCEIIFQLDYQIENGPIKSLARVTERSNGNASFLDLDLSALAGSNVKFLFTMIANGSTPANWGLWVDPTIVQVVPPLQSISSISGVSTSSPMSASPPLSTPGTCNRVIFEKDVTVPDGTNLKPRQSFTKIWRLKNAGTCTWTTSYSVFFAGRDALAAPVSVNIPFNVKPGQTVDVAVNMVAPDTSGHFIGYWKLRDPQGTVFGTGSDYNNPFWVDINVVIPK